MAVRLFGNRRGMFFTLVAILIITVVFVSFSPEYSSTIDYQTEVTQSRVEAANELVETIKYSYVPAAIEASSYHALKWLSHCLKTRGDPSSPCYGYDAIPGPGQGFHNRSEFNTTFEWMMMNGTLRCPNPSSCPFYNPKMEKVNFRNLLAELETASRDYSQIETNFTAKNFNLSLYQNRETGAFQVGVNLTINFSVDAGLARWDDLENISVFFEFEGIEDPLYAIHDTGLSGYVNVFNATNLTNYNISNTLLAIEQRTYRYAGERLVAGPDKAKYHGPSFLDRFVDGDNVNHGLFFDTFHVTANYSACCGLESLINPDTMGISAVSSNSYVDWCYFDPSGSSECNDPSPKGVKCITDGGFDSFDAVNNVVHQSGGPYIGFKIDELHAGTYNLTYADLLAGTKTYLEGSARAEQFGDCP